MISIGGKSDGSTKYSLMAMNDDSRKEFVESVIDFLKTYNFDGLDFNWYKINFNNIINYLKIYQGISRILRSGKRWRKPRRQEKFCYFN